MCDKKAHRNVKLFRFSGVCFINIKQFMVPHTANHEKIADGICPSSLNRRS